jgi:hypothetical protein
LSPPAEEKSGEEGKLSAVTAGVKSLMVSFFGTKKAAGDDKKT